DRRHGPVVGPRPRRAGATGRPRVRAERRVRRGGRIRPGGPPPRDGQPRRDDRGLPAGEAGRRSSGAVTGPPGPAPGPEPGTIRGALPCESGPGPTGRPMNEVTHVLAALEQGDPHAADRLLPLVYDELRKLAAARLAAEAPGQTLQPTALAHEAYLRLVGADETSHWAGRGH